MTNETATVATSAQDIASRVEKALYPEAAPLDESEGIEETEVLDGAEELPEGDDSDQEESEESTDLEDAEAAAEEEGLSLAEYLGVDEDRIVVGEDGSVSVNAIIDGETKPVSLKDLVSSYQLQGHVNNKSMVVENDRKQFEEVKQRVAHELKQRLEGVSKLGELAEQELVNEYQSIDWDALRSQDPANWTALRQEYAERAQKIQQVQQLATEEAQRLQQEQASQYEAKAHEYFKNELDAMLKDNPEWADVEVRKAKVGELRTFMTRYGFTEKDALGVNDHRLIRLIKDAKAYRDGEKAAETKKVVKTLPKFQKPGSSKVVHANLAKARKMKAQKAKIKSGGGNVNDIAAALIDRM